MRCLPLACVLAQDVISGDKPHLATCQLRALKQIASALSLSQFEASCPEGLLGGIQEMAEF